jgi:hypothetical protein
MSRRESNLLSKGKLVCGHRNDHIINGFAGAMPIEVGFGSAEAARA